MSAVRILFGGTVTTPNPLVTSGYVNASSTVGSGREELTGNAVYQYLYPTFGDDGGTITPWVVVNTGTLKAINDGVYLNGANDTVTNTSSGVILGDTYGVRTNGLVVNYGSISGRYGIVDDWGVFHGVTVLPTVLNEGIISATGTGDGVNLGGAARNDGYPSVSVINEPQEIEAGGEETFSGGVIQGGNGVSVDLLDATVTNFGTIKGTGGEAGGSGLDLIGSEATVTNAAQAYIFGVDAGVDIEGHLGSRNTLINDGTVVGGTGVTSFGYYNTVIAYGTIIGTSGVAIDIGYPGGNVGYDLIVAYPEAKIAGSIVWDDGTGVLKLAASKSGLLSAGTLAGLEGNLRLQDIDIDEGANWYLSGNISGSTSLINGGALSVIPGQSLLLQGSATGAVTVTDRSTLYNFYGATITQSVGPAVVVDGTAGSVTNNGSIISSGTADGLGVTLVSIGRVTNSTNTSSTASIYGYVSAVDLGDTGSTLVNYGTLSSSKISGTAVKLYRDDTLLNAQGGFASGVFGTGLIDANVGVYAVGATITNGALPLFKHGIITGNTAVVLGALYPSTLTNFASIVGGDTGVYLQNGIISNDATIEGTSASATGVEMKLADYTTLINGPTSAAFISGQADGILLHEIVGEDNPALVENYGRVSGNYGIEVLNAYGTIDNGGMVAPNTPTTPSAATVAGTSFGIFLIQSGLSSSATAAVTIVNDGTIKGQIGVEADNRLKLINAGGIIGSNGDAVEFTGSSDVLAVAPGAAFVGAVEANADDMLELIGTALGTIVGFGTSITNFGTVTVDANAIWEFAGSSTIGSGVSLINNGTIEVRAGNTLTLRSALLPTVGAANAVEVFPFGTVNVYGSVAASQRLAFAPSAGGVMQIDDPGGFAGTISGFVPGTAIYLPFIDVTRAAVAGGVLTVQEVGGGVLATLPVTGNFSGEHISYDQNSTDTGTTLTVVTNVSCFAAGTRIATDHGDIAVENLRIGDRVRTEWDQSAPVIWIGHRRIHCARHPRPAKVWPVRILAGAFGPRVPHRDVLLSADHAVFADGCLVPVHCLLNGTTVVQQPCEGIVYWHVELPDHNVIFAEGLSCESYLDTGGRQAFDNGAGGVVAMHPDFFPLIWEARACAPLIVTGPELDHLRRRVDGRAAAVLAQRTGGERRSARVQTRRSEQLA